jgi:hypothetical protein
MTEYKYNEQCRWIYTRTPNERDGMYHTECRAEVKESLMSSAIGICENCGRPVKRLGDIDDMAREYDDNTLTIVYMQGASSRNEQIATLEKEIERLNEKNVRDGRKIGDTLLSLSEKENECYALEYECGTLQCAVIDLKKEIETMRKDIEYLIYHSLNLEIDDPIISISRGREMLGYATMEEFREWRDKYK